MGAGLLDGLSPAMRAELRVHIPHMRPDGVDRQRKLVGDLRRGQVGWQEAQNLASADRLVLFAGRTSGTWHTVILGLTTRLGAVSAPSLSLIHI